MVCKDSTLTTFDTINHPSRVSHIHITLKMSETLIENLANLAFVVSDSPLALIYICINNYIKAHYARSPRVVGSCELSGTRNVVG